MEQYVYIHGVVAEQDRPANHTRQYEALRNGIDRELRKLGGDPLPAIHASVTVEWGWDTPDAGETGKLAVAQSVIANRVKTATPRDRTGFTSLLYAPAVQPVRKLIMFGWSDIVYYVGKRGKKLVRSLVWNQILDQIDTDQDVDLTIICHSAGTLIAHDFLYWVFSGDRDDPDSIIEQGIDPAKVAAAPSQLAGSQTGHLRISDLSAHGPKRRCNRHDGSVAVSQTRCHHVGIGPLGAQRGHASLAQRLGPPRRVVIPSPALLRGCQHR